MNTKITYQYRDSQNYKKWEEVVIEGQISFDAISPFLYDKEFFIPSVVGLEDLQKMPFREYDHVWHEILAVTDTDKSPTCKVIAKEIVSSFESASSASWRQSEVFERKGLL